MCRQSKCRRCLVLSLVDPDNAATDYLGSVGRLDQSQAQHRDSERTQYIHRRPFNPDDIGQRQANTDVVVQIGKIVENY
ncbi:hypothetical protein D3C85_1627940 [compost metagenome]